MSRGNAKPNNKYFECFMKQNELVTDPCFQMSLLRIEYYDFKIFSTSFHILSYCIMQHELNMSRGNAKPDNMYFECFMK